MQLFSADATIFFLEIQIFFAPKNMKKLPSKVAHNWLGLAVFSLASFCFVQLREF